MSKVPKSMASSRQPLKEKGGIKVLYLTTSLSMDGISASICSVLKKLKDRGMEVFCASGGGKRVLHLEKLGVPHFPVMVHTKNELHPKLFLAFLQLAEIIKSYQITHVHAHTRVTQVVAAGLGRFLGVKYVSTCHSFYRRKTLRRFFPAWGVKTVAVSEAVREQLVNHFRLPKSNVVLIPNGIDGEKYRRKLTEYDRKVLREYYHLGRAQFVIGSLSRIEKSKGYQYLIQAMPQILQVFPQTKLVLAGQGKYQDHLSRLARKLGVGREVIFTGPVDDVTFLLEIMDLFVLPAVWAEGLGFSVLEAMAMGKPIVAANTGGLYSLVKEEENGFLVPPRDVQGLASAIIRLMQDRNLLERMGKKSLEIAHESFSLDKTVDRVAQLYQEL